MQQCNSTKKKTYAGNGYVVMILELSSSTYAQSSNVSSLCHLYYCYFSIANDVVCYISALCNNIIAPMDDLKYCMNIGNRETS